MPDTSQDLINIVKQLLCKRNGLNDLGSTVWRLPMTLLFPSTTVNEFSSNVTETHDGELCDEDSCWSVLDMATLLRPMYGQM